MAVASIKGSASGYTPWARPSDWLALPAVVVGDQKLVALVHVLPTGANTLISFSVSGAYTVDWGDGTAAQNVATGVQVTHSYDPTTLPATLTSDGYKQAVLTITMQAGNTMTAVDLSRLPTGSTSPYAQPFRDIAMAGASVNALTLGGTTKNQTRWFTYVGPSSITSLTNFAGASCAQLRGFTGTQWTASVTTMQNAFQMPALETVPLFDLGLCGNWGAAFQGASRLRSLPLFNTSGATSMSNAFSGCANLQAIPLWDVSHVTDFSGAFTGCVALSTIPLLNTSAGTNFLSMFSGCSGLQSIPALDVGNAITLNAMFNGCSSAVSWPAAFNTAKCTDFSSMFANCFSMVTHPAMTVSVGTQFLSMFTGCTSLTALNLPTSTAGVNFATMCQSCSSLRTINLNMSLAANAASSSLATAGTVLAAISSLTLTGLRFAMTGANVTANQQLSAAALNALYTSLGTASGAQTLVVSGNPGSGSSTISIATAKGWTVTGG